MTDIPKDANLNKMLGRLLDLLADEKCKVPLRQEQIKSVLEAGSE